MNKHNKSWILLLLSILCWAVRPISAVTLDDSFDEDGKVLTDWSAGTTFIPIGKLLEQNDGKIVAAGTAGAGGTHFALMRFNVNGTVDTTFGDDGKVVFDLWEYNSTADIALDANGKIVLLGYSSHTASDSGYVAVARFNLDGTFDRTFSGDGWTLTAVGFSPQPRAIAVDNSNRVVVVGSGRGNSHDLFAIRYNSNGSPDTTFDGDGKLLPSFSSNVADAQACYDVAIDSQGRILLAGALKGLLVTARLNSNGSFDAGFGGKGFVVDTSIGATINSQVAALSTGNIAVTGEKYGDAATLCQLRYFDTGTRQRSFGKDGYAKATLGAFPATSKSYLVSVAPTGSVTIAALASTNHSASYHVRLARFSSGGALYTNFGGDGIVDLTLLQDSPGALLVKRDGRSVVSAGLDYGQQSLVSLRTNGDFDALWNGGTITSSKVSSDQIRDVAIDNNGKIVVIGELFQTQALSVLARYSPDGKLDAAFGNGGKIVSPWPDKPRFSCVATDASNRIVVAGSVSFNGKICLFLTRYNANGSLDNSFGNAGRVVSTASINQFCSGLVITKAGKIIAMASGLLARFNDNGSPDTTFGTGKPVPGYTNIGSGGNLALDTAERLLFGGTSTSRNFIAGRCTANGLLDTSFGTGGKVEIDLANSQEGWAVAGTPDGKIVVSGYSEPTTSGIGTRYAGGMGALVRLNANGSLDTSFNGSGKLLVPNAQGFDDVVVDKLGRIWANVYGASDFKLARVLPNGRLDSAFGSGGFASVDFGGFDTSVALAQDKSGRMVIGGLSDANGDNDFALARLDDTPQIVVDGDSAMEGDSGTVNLRFTVTLTAPSLNSVMVQYTTADGTARAGSDYAAKSGTLTFLPGQIEKRLVVVVYGDTLKEQDETVLLQLSNAINADLSEAPGLSVIVNDD